MPRRPTIDCLAAGNDAARRSGTRADPDSAKFAESTPERDSDAWRRRHRIFDSSAKPGAPALHSPRPAPLRARPAIALTCWHGACSCPERPRSAEGCSDAGNLTRFFFYRACRFRLWGLPHRDRALWSSACLAPLTLGELGLRTSLPFASRLGAADRLGRGHRPPHRPHFRARAASRQDRRAFVFPGPGGMGPSDRARGAWGLHIVIGWAGGAWPCGRPRPWNRRTWRCA